MRIAITFCFFSCFLLAFGQQQQDSMFLPRNISLFQDSGFAPQNNNFFNNYSSSNSNTLYDSINDPFGKITDNSIVSSAKDKFKNPFASIGKKLKLKPEFHGTTSLQTQFVDNGYAPPGTNGFYTTARISGQVSILKIPLNAGIAVQMHNQQFRLDYTAANLNFDANGFKNNIKNEYQNYISDIKNYFGDGLGKIMEQYKDSVDKLENYKSILSNSNYYDQVKQYSSKLSQLEDSLHLQQKAAQLADSLHLNEKIAQAEDSLHIDSAKAALTDYYNRVKDTLNNLKGVREAYKKTSAYVKKYKQYSQMLDEYKGYVDKVKNMKTDDVMKLPGIQNVLKKRGISMPKFDFLSRIQKMNIGRVAADVSRYTFRQQSMYGIQLDYLTKKNIYVGGAYGWTSQFNLQLTPSFFYNSQYRNFDISRMAGYLRGGYGGLNDNHIHVIWAGYGDKFNPALSMESGTAQANSVLSVEFLQKIGKAIIIKGEAATSNSSNSSRIASVLPVSLKAPSFAGYTEITGKIKATNSTIMARGEAVSNNFISMTAPFLRRNIAGYTLGLEQLLFKGKVTYTGLLQHSFQNFADKTLRNALISSSNTLMIQASSKATFQLYYGWFGNIPGKESTIGYLNQTHTATLAQQYSYSTKKVRMVTVLTTAYSYSFSQAPEIQSTTLHNFQQGLQQQFVFPKQISWNIGAGGLYRTQPTITTTPETSSGNNNIGWWVETGNTFSIKKIVKMKYQLKYLYDPTMRQQLSVAHTTDIMLYKGLRLNVGGIYYIYLSQQYIPSNRISATAGLAYSW